MKAMSLSTLFLLTLSFIANDAMKCVLKNGQRVTSGATQIKSIIETGMTPLRCAALCSINACGSFHLSQTENVCELFSEFLYIYKHCAELTSDPQWMVGYGVLVTGGDWVLAFRAVKENNVSVFNTWNDWSLQHDNPVLDSFPHACLRLVNTRSCDRHFRSQILENWTNIKEVRFSMVKSDTEMAYAQFNGTGTSRDSWFTPDRILSSTWSPGVLTDEFTYPSIEGVCEDWGCRRFLLYGPFERDCSIEWFYAMTKDSSEEFCVRNGLWPYAEDVEQFPQFYYSATSERSSLAEDTVYPIAESADALAVWVKFT